MRAVAFDVVVFDVVVKVGVPGVAHQRIQDVREERVDNTEGEPFGEDPALVDVLMFEESVRTHVIPLHEKVKDGVGEGEVTEEEEGGGDGGQRVDEEVSEEDDVGFVADAGARPLYVGGDEL